MMRSRFAIAWILAIVASAGIAGPAAASMIAGWDFSHYVAQNFLSVDGATLSGTLDANYSNLDSTFGAGAESAAFGTMYLDGSFGSDSSFLDFVNQDPFVPVDQSLASNLAGGAPSVPFDSFAILLNEGGQVNAAAFSMNALDAFSAVFAADLSSVADQGSAWSISFGGKTFAGAASVGVEFSTDGANYTSFGSVNLTTVDTLFNVALGATASDLAYVRLSFTAPGAAGAGLSIIDNVALKATLVPVPEPGTAGMLLLGLAGLAHCSRRRCA